MDEVTVVTCERGGGPNLAKLMRYLEGELETYGRANVKATSIEADSGGGVMSMYVDGLRVTVEVPR